MTRLEAEDRQGLPAATKNWEKAREDPPSPAAKTSEGAGPALISRFWPAEPQEGPHLFVSDHPVWCFVMAQRTHSHAPPQCQTEGSGGKQEGNAAGTSNQDLEETKEETGRNASSASSSRLGQEAVALVAESRLLLFAVLLAGVRGV